MTTKKTTTKKAPAKKRAPRKKAAPKTNGSAAKAKPKAAPKKSLPEAFTLERIVLLKVLRAVAASASTDEIRPHINCVLFEFDKTGVTLVATDGHRLTRFALTVPVLGTGNLSVPVSIAHVDRLLRLLRPKGKMERLSIVTVTPTLTEGLMVHIEQDLSVPLPMLDVSFPPYDKVIPSHKTGDASRVDVNPMYVLELGKLGRALNVSQLTLSPVVGDREPIRFDGQSEWGSLTHVIMPMRPDAKDKKKGGRK